ncbi:hypothetical protein NDU88_002440 [Pleurodeles waltl]|uniref:Uncharacterized protein n=1 Tax=Pleurodeles waltl TaxID=8319 RepID=A0AAV7VCL9_PLEWA|nr:hypothetical protein NDU88_002440 [Pleurodeles waltl]
MNAKAVWVAEEVNPRSSRSSLGVVLQRRCNVQHRARLAGAKRVQKRQRLNQKRPEKLAEEAREDGTTVPTTIAIATTWLPNWTGEDAGSGFRNP